MKTTQEKIAVMQAYADGSKIQQRRQYTSQWKDSERPTWDWDKFDYRIKPKQQEPKYRPYQSADEVLEDWKIHGPLLKRTDAGVYLPIERLSNYVVIEGRHYLLDSDDWSGKYTWQDGTPFGRKEE